MREIEKNIENILQRITDKCDSSGRNISEITLIAVSKLHSVEEIQIASKFGLINFGENKAQELDEKFKQLEGRQFNWHFIGHLQSNKVKTVVPIADLIHSVDSTKLADEINKRAKNIDKIQKILLEVKTSDEISKYGIQDFDSLMKIVEYCENLSNVKILGLMTMAPFTENETVIRNSFKKLANFKKLLNDKGFDFQHLSMGMTGDFEIGIEEGATILRIGTAIFGERNYLLNK